MGKWNKYLIHSDRQKNGEEDRYRCWAAGSGNHSHLIVSTFSESDQLPADERDVVCRNFIKREKGDFLNCCGTFDLLLGMKKAG